jgi:predicted RND superfamily exporter protein
MNHVTPASHCRCPHHKVVPVLIILFGLSFLLGTLGWLDASIIRFAWPTLIILIGVVKLFSGSCKCYMSNA